MQYITLLEKEYMKPSVPAFRPGDTIKVQIKVVEGTRERLQAFEGICLERKNSGPKETITLRRISHGVGVERTLLLHSPRVESIEVIKQGAVRKARLTYLRGKVGRAARIQEKRVAFETSEPQA